jgi:colicin import membrane protein
MAKPGVVLRRQVGSNGPFSEDAELPPDLPIDNAKERQTQPRLKRKEPPARKVDDKAAKDAALAFERRRKEEAAREKQRKRQEEAIAKAERALEAAKRDHETKIKTIANDFAAVERRSQAEDARWKKQKAKLEAALRRASD